MSVYAIKLESDVKTCIFCSKVLTEEEIQYYHDTCEICETEIDDILYSEVDELPKNWNSEMWRKK
ncbi:MAG: hypothetical protein ACRC4Y_05885 [Cetobacterium sp.]